MLASQLRSGPLPPAEVYGVFGRGLNQTRSNGANAPREISLGRFDRPLWLYIQRVASCFEGADCRRAGPLAAGTLHRFDQASLLHGHILLRKMQGAAACSVGFMIPAGKLGSITSWPFVFAAACPVWPRMLGGGDAAMPSNQKLDTRHGIPSFSCGGEVFPCLLFTRLLCRQYVFWVAWTTSRNGQQFLSCQTRRCHDEPRQAQRSVCQHRCEFGSDGWMGGGAALAR